MGVSLAPEIRPSANKNPDGSLKPFYLRREFKYLEGDVVETHCRQLGRSVWRCPLARIFIRGHMVWRGAHPIADGAQKVDFVADEAYEVMAMHPGFADLLNKVSAQGYDKWEVNKLPEASSANSSSRSGSWQGRTSWSTTSSTSTATCCSEWRNIDGRGFDKEENRPTNLQIPLVRK